MTDHQTNLLQHVRRGWARGTTRTRHYLRDRGDGYSDVLNWASLFSLMIMFSMIFLDGWKILSTFWLFACLFVSIALGLFVFAAFVEKVMAKKIIEFKSTQLFWLGTVALVTYVAHGQAGEEVNAIFSQDASAFPYATTAATVMAIAAWAEGPALVIAGLSFVYGAYKMFSSDAAYVMTALTLGINLISFGSFVDHQIARDVNRRSNIYQIALAMDFNGQFRCAKAKNGVDSAAFIGTDQRRALIAPPIVVRQQSSKSLFKLVEVPNEFYFAECR
jgi:hypothetical protein